MARRKANIKATYELTIRTKSTCPARDAVLEIIDSGNADKIKVVIGSEKEDGSYALYIDEENPENLFGIVKEAKSKDGDLDDATVEKLLSDNNYKIVIKERTGAKITGRLDIIGADDVVVSSAVGEGIQKLMQEKIDAGIVTKEDMDERIRVMKENHVDELLMARVIRGYRKYKKAPKKPSCIYVDPFLQSSLKRKEEPLISEILRSAVSRNGIIFEGEKSVGKNVCANTIAWLLGMPERLFTCSRQMTTSTLYGEKTTDNSALDALNSQEIESMAIRRIAAGRSNNRLTQDDYIAAAKYDIIKAKAASTNIIIEDSELVDWLIDGGILILNEMNLCEPNLLASFLNPILDGTGYLTIQGRGEVKVNPDCVLIGTQNSDYAGTEEQNEATMSRLACERFRQPETIEKLLVNAVQAKLDEDGFGDTSIDLKYIKQAEGFYNACRTSVEDGLISNAVLNIRGFVRALAAVYESGGYCRLARQIELNVINTCPQMEAESLRGTLKSRVTL